MQFYGAQSFNSDLSHWNVSNLMDATQMFSEASKFNQNLCSWAGLLPLNVTVSMMFTASGCLDTSDPVLEGGQVRGPFCSQCQERL
jgi:Mycoplasma protein of unknown function, DUF285